jgi:hypothetical protein
MQLNAYSHFLHKPLQIGPIFVRTFLRKMISRARSWAMDTYCGALYIFKL